MSRCSIARMVRKLKQEGVFVDKAFKCNEPFIVELSLCNIKCIQEYIPLYRYRLFLYIMLEEWS